MQREHDSTPPAEARPTRAGPRRRRAFGVAALLAALALAGCEDDAPSPAASDFGKALTEIEGGNPAAAERSLVRAIAQDPAHAPSHAALGRLDEARGRFAAARAHYEAARDANENSPEGHWQLGRLALEQGLLSDALRHCTAAQHLGPTDASIMTLRSRLMQRVGLLTGAEEVAKGALSRRPGDVAATLQLAAVRTAATGPVAGIEVLRVAEADGTALPPGAMLSLYDRLGRPEEAINLLFARLVDAESENARWIARALTERLLQAGRGEQAETMLEAHLVEDPRDAIALALRARLAFAREGADAARSRIRAGSALAGEPGGETEGELLAMIDSLVAGDDTDLLNARALELSDPHGEKRLPLPKVDGNAVLPLETLEAALVEAGEEAPPVLLALVGEARASAGNDTGAREIFDRALLESLGHVQVLEVYARALIAQGEPEAARAVLSTYRSERTGDRRLGALLGAHLEAAGDHAALGALAEAAFADAALSGLPDPYAESLLEAAIATAISADAPDRARDYAEAAASAHPSHGAPHVVLATLHRAAGQKLPAIEAARRAIDLMPGRPEGYLTLARLLAADDREAALSVLERGIARNARTAALRFDRAALLERKGDRAGAIAEYEHLHAIAPEALVVVNNLASLMAGGPRLDDVSPERLDRAAELANRLSAHSLPEFYDTRGWIAVKRGAPADGLPLLQRAAAARPDHPVIHYHLGIAHYLSGDSGTAAEQLRYMLSLDSIGAIEYEDEAVRVLAKVERQGSGASRGMD
ncbi:MAG: tetratricopeptide repeat protein [Pseudomonadota bacterium]